MYQIYIYTLHYANTMDRSHGQSHLRAMAHSFPRARQGQSSPGSEADDESGPVPGDDVGPMGKSPKVEETYGIFDMFQWDSHWKIMGNRLKMELLMGKS